MTMRMMIAMSLLLLAVTLTWAEDVVADALETTGIRTGLAAVVGADDETWALALAQTGRFVVEDLQADWDTVYAHRAAYAAAGAFPMASTQYQADTAHLPYANQLINLLIIDADALGDAAPDDDEIRRALVWGGQAYVRRGGRWSAMDNPMPEDVDEWPHALRGPDRRPVSTDRRIRPHMQGLRWMADEWRDMSQQGAGMRIADGRLYYARVSGSRRSGLRYELVARDAQNGTLLWTRDLPWMPGRMPWSREESMEYSHTFAAGNDRLYCYGETDGPLVALDGATGEIVMRYDQTARLQSGSGRLPSFLHRGRGDPEQTTLANIEDFLQANVLVVGDRIVQTFGPNIWVLDEATGAILGHYEHDQRVWSTLVGEDGHIYSAHEGLAFSLTMPDCELRWQTALPYEGRIHAVTGPLNGCWPVHLRGDGDNGNIALIMLNTENGEIRWQTDRRIANHAVMLEDRLTIDGWRGSRDYNPMTGEYLGGHGISGDMAGCSYPTYTPEYLIRGLTLHSRSEPNRAWLGDGARPNCQIPTYPAYGQLFLFGTNCGCSAFLRAGISSYYADEPVTPDPIEQRLSRATSITALNPSAVQALAIDSIIRDDWRRGDQFYEGVKGFNLQSMPGSVLQAVSRRFNETWYNPNTRVRSVTAGDWTVSVQYNRNVLVGSRGDAAVWAVPLGGRVFIDPVIVEDTVIVGQADGYLSAFALDDGALRWQFQAAPYQRRVVASGMIESAWPVSALTVWENQLLVTAGRRDSFDDGLFVTCIDLTDQSVLWHERIGRPRDEVTTEEDRLRRGYNGFGNKRSTMSGLWQVNDHDTAFWMIGSVPVSPQLRANPLQPEMASPSGLQPGVSFRYYEYQERPRGVMPDLLEMTPDLSGTTALPSGEFAEAPRTGRHNGYHYGLIFDGYLHIPEGGMYRFHLFGTSMGYLRMDGQIVAEFNSRSAMGPLIPVAAGVYDIEVGYSTDSRQTGRLVISLRPDGVELPTEIPAEQFYHRP